MSTGTLKRHFGTNADTDREERAVSFRELIDAFAPSAQPFRTMGKGLPGRGSGPRLTDRERYK